MKTMTPPRLSYLFTFHAECMMDALSGTPLGQRMVATITGGHFSGPELKGDVLSGGGDWLLLRADGTCSLDVRAVLKPHNGPLILMDYRGIRSGPPEILERIKKGEPVDADTFYQRISVYFETSANPFGWLNSIVSVGTLIRREKNRIVYEIFKVQ